MGEVIELGPHERMTPEEALGFALKEEWECVVICGFRPGIKEMSMRSSAMTRKDALWIAKKLEQYALGND